MFINELKTVKQANYEKHDNLLVWATHAPPIQQDKFRVIPGSLGTIVRSYKAAVTRAINQLRSAPGDSIWQRNYYERVLRGERELDEARFAL